MFSLQPNCKFKPARVAPGKRWPCPNKHLGCLKDFGRAVTARNHVHLACALQGKGKKKVPKLLLMLDDKEDGKSSTSGSEVG